MNNIVIYYDAGSVLNSSTQDNSYNNMTLCSATGETFTSLQYMYRVGRTTIGEIVMDTCQAITDTLQPEFLKVIKHTVH